MRTDDLRSGRSRLAAALAAVSIAVVTVACSNQATVKRSITAESIAGKAGFSIASMTVTRGSKVELTVKNTTDKTHGFSIDELGVRRTVDPGKPVTVKFKASKAGTFRIYCQIHPTHGTAQFVVPQ